MSKLDNGILSFVIEINYFEKTIYEVEGYTDETIKNLIKANEMMSGWGNGYCILPNDHPIANLDVYEAEIALTSNWRHRPITFSESWEYFSIIQPVLPFDKKQVDKNSWVVGFNTMSALHCSKTTWPKERVVQEAELLEKLVRSLYLVQQ